MTATVKWRSFILVGNENSIMLWSGNLKEQNYFGERGGDLRVKFIWTLKYRLCEIMFPHCRVRWWSVVTRGLNCCCVRGALLGCVTVGVLRLAVGCGIIQNWSLQIQWSAKGKQEYKWKDAIKASFLVSWAPVHSKQLL